MSSVLSVCLTTVNKIHDLESRKSRMQLVIYIWVGLCKVWALLHHVCIVFTLNQQVVMSSLINCSRYA